jgi:hypothetical protein
MISNRNIACVLALGLSALPAFSQGTSYTYFALGDSIPFGFDPTELFDGKAKPNDFAGYPEALAGLQRRNHANAACPGETSESFRTGTQLDKVAMDRDLRDSPPSRRV